VVILPPFTPAANVKIDAKNCIEKPKYSIVASGKRDLCKHDNVIGL